MTFRPIGPVKAIIHEEAERNGLTVEQLLKRTRNVQIAEARQYAMYRAFTEATENLCALGRYFQRDRATVRYAVQKMQQRSAQQ